MATNRSVNRPTDVKVKERDVNNKLQLFGIFTGEVILGSPRAKTTHVIDRPPADASSVSQPLPMARSHR